MMTRQRLLSCLICTLLLGPIMIASAIAGPVDMAPINAMDRAAFVVNFKEKTIQTFEVQNVAPLFPL